MFTCVETGQACCRRHPWGHGSASGWGWGGGRAQLTERAGAWRPIPSTRRPGRRPAKWLYLKLVHHLAYPTSLLADDVAVKVIGHLHFNGDGNQCL